MEALVPWSNDYGFLANPLMQLAKDCQAALPSFDTLATTVDDSFIFDLSLFGVSPFECGTSCRNIPKNGGTEKMKFVVKTLDDDESVVTASTVDTFLSEIEEEDYYYSATAIQALVRGAQVRDRTREMIREESCIFIQSIARGFLVRKSSRRSPIQGDSMNRSATIIQTLARGVMARDRVRSMIREEYAIFIQSVARGMIARNKARDTIREEYAIFIQSVARGMIARNKIQAKNIPAHDDTIKTVVPVEIIQEKEAPQQQQIVNDTRVSRLVSWWETRASIETKMTCTDDEVTENFIVSEIQNGESDDFEDDAQEDQILKENSAFIIGNFVKGVIARNRSKKQQIKMDIANKAAMVVISC